MQTLHPLVTQKLVLVVLYHLKTLQYPFLEHPFCFGSTQNFISLFRPLIFDRFLGLSEKIDTLIISLLGQRDEELFMDKTMVESMPKFRLRHYSYHEKNWTYGGKLYNGMEIIS